MAKNKKRSKYGVDTSAKGKEKRTYNGKVLDSETEMKFLKEWIEPIAILIMSWVSESNIYSKRVIIIIIIRNHKSCQIK